MTDIAYGEKRDILVRASVAVGRYCVKAPRLYEPKELSRLIDEMTEAYVNAVCGKAFVYAEAEFDAWSASAKAEKFETRQYLLTFSVTEMNADMISLLIESTALRGLCLTGYARSAVVWGIERKRPLSLSEVRAELRCGVTVPRAWRSSYDGFYIKAGRATLFRRLKTELEGQRLRDRGKIYTELCL